MAGSGAHAKFFYRDEYIAGVIEAGIRHTFDVTKPRRIRDALVDSTLIRADEFIPPASVRDDELRLVHTEDYLRLIGEPETLAKLLFLDPSRPWGANLLQPFLYASGGTIAAARAAVADRGIAVNLGGGFHHAQADKAEGFCAIADVAIAIRALRAERLVERVLIVDLDYHHGNGNAEIFREDETVFTFSIHSNNWCWITKRNNLDVELPAHTRDAAYLDAIAAHLPRILRQFRPDFAVYVAGSDPFIEDALGDFDITEPGMLERDAFVTEALRGRDVPFAVVTAGGYGDASWRIHFNYFRWLLAAAQES